MKVDSKLLNLALKRVGPAIGNSATMPILSSVLIEDNTIRATNLNLTYVEDLASDGETMVLPYKETFDITALIDDDIEIIQTDDQIVIKHGRTEFKLGKPSDSKTFPALPIVNPLVRFNTDIEFLNAVKAASKFVMPAGAGATLCNICVNVFEDRIEIAGSSGHVMYCYKLSEGVHNPRPIQANFTPALARALNDFSSFEVQIDEKFISISDSVTQIIMRLSDVKYPDYSMFFANMTSPNFFCQKKNLINCLNLISVLPDEGEAVVFDLTEKNNCKVNVNISTTSKAVKANFDCNNLIQGIDKIALDIINLKAMASLVSTEEVSMAITNANRAVYVTDPFNDKVLMLMMPTVLK